MQITRSSLVTAAAAVALWAGLRTACALDPKETAGVGSRGVSLPPTMGSLGKSGEDGLARPGPTVGDFKGGVGITPGGATGSTNLSTEAAYHASGMGKQINAGVGYSTMQTVPGRSPTYINLVAGKRMESWVASIGP